MTNGAWLIRYHDFISNKETQQFAIVDGPTVISDSQNALLLVLDSSFNPPHWGHYTLVKKAYECYRDLYPGKSVHVLLSLSVNNADKGGEKPATFDKRVAMMHIMARILEDKMPEVEVSIGLSVFPKFVDKDASIRKQFFQHGEVVYLVGYDTIVRIFDAKYYKPDTPAIVLNEFMRQTELCCLTRLSGDVTPEMQQRYPLDILHGEYEPSIPKEWGNRIKVIANDAKYIGVSSSAIRKEITTNRGNLDLDGLQQLLPGEIISYIVGHSKAKSIFEG
ncbi:nicotinamide-nucleotide adenylyltransferase KNAG_0C00350 [Huiozyma naganishii CBS 8797]|uniref:Cytidyltransferase-like domain-containing protein n=1 Tax=Huiozyma naganishii (strain ATCC MYA-139 / BCRC 22969 / CBS 8797 / KCTC 17520 / NBRC 10181 / NCYC 3082 / Yp74L-3) TaxID=1071383 RepID=J7S486_HUIN7|nr:hypothetical protein KNAG_0C00350 [Kazachstania naganishii CBS 8797]CCK69149.1 hypothetical protein KNAG_0C00350 [Kazachstania naganishii CBS 8797]